MTTPVTIHDGYYKIDTQAWLNQRTGQHLADLSAELCEFTRCDVFGEYQPQMDTAARMRLWCAARGFGPRDGDTWHDDEILTHPVCIVLAVSGRQALALISIGNGAPEVFSDITTDEGYWADPRSVDIACPAEHRWTWDGSRDLYTCDSPSQSATLSALFGGGSHAPYSRCRSCAAFDDGTTSAMCPCSGTAIYCPTCGSRCELQLTGVPAFA